MTETEPLICYRGWGVSSDGTLTPVGMQTGSRWPMAPRHMQAICNKSDYGGFSQSYNMILSTMSSVMGLPIPEASNEPPPAHNAPHWDCGCGIYGFKTPDSLEQVLDSAILGRVALWGRYVETELGYRGEFAYPQMLYMPKDATPEALKQISTASRLYRIEVVPLPDVLEAKLELRHKEAEWMQLPTLKGQPPSWNTIMGTQWRPGKIASYFGKPITETDPITLADPRFKGQHCQCRCRAEDHVRAGCTLCACNGFKAKHYLPAVQKPRHWMRGGV